jgi:hypothetical protein
MTGADPLAVLAVVAVVFGPGAGVWVAVGGIRRDNERTYQTLTKIEGHLAVLNHRVTKSEGHIEGLEGRERR